MSLRNLTLMKAVLFFALSLLTVCANAELFKWKDADGNIIFSDQPPHTADKAESEVKLETLPHINTVPAADLIKSRITKPVKSGSNKANYKNFAIISPLPDSEIRENSGKIHITIQVEPDNFSERGNQLVIHMDGIEVYKGENTSVLLHNMDRGTHSIKASIVTNRGFVLRETRSTTFTLHRFHI